jgi:hypothetical protein
LCHATGRTPHALMQWLSVSRSGGDRAWLGGEPRQGELQPEALRHLLRVLGRLTDPARPCFHAAVLTATDLETWPVEPDDDLSHHGDAINR